MFGLEAALCRLGFVTEFGPKGNLNDGMNLPFSSSLQSVMPSDTFSCLRPGRQPNLMKFCKVGRFQTLLASARRNQLLQSLVVRAECFFAGNPDAAVRSNLPAPPARVCKPLNAKIHRKMSWTETRGIVQPCFVI